MRTQRTQEPGFFISRRIPPTPSRSARASSPLGPALRSPSLNSATSSRRLAQRVARSSPGRRKALSAPQLLRDPTRASRRLTAPCAASSQLYARRLEQQIEMLATKRLQKEALALAKDPPPGIRAKPDEKNILTFHYVIEGSADTPYAGGHYHGTLKFPPEYPLKFVAGAARCAGGGPFPRPSICAVCASNEYASPRLLIGSSVCSLPPPPSPTGPLVS